MIGSTVRSACRLLRRRRLNARVLPVPFLDCTIRCCFRCRLARIKDWTGLGDSNFKTYERLLRTYGGSRSFSRSVNFG